MVELVKHMDGDLILPSHLQYPDVVGGDGVAWSERGGEKRRKETCYVCSSAPKI